LKPDIPIYVAKLSSISVNAKSMLTLALPVETALRSVDGATSIREDEIVGFCDAASRAGHPPRRQGQCFRNTRTKQSPFTQATTRTVIMRSVTGIERFSHGIRPGNSAERQLIDI
jgi:hypothetical protein